jgi:hypothetical protein
VAQTELRAFGQSSSDTQQTKESIPNGKGLLWACSAPAKCIRLTTTAVEKIRHTARNIAGGIAGSVFYKQQFSLCSTSVWILRPKALQLRRYLLFRNPVFVVSPVFV